MSESKTKDILKSTSKFLLLIILQGIAAAASLLLIPKEAGNADFLGYSFKRLALLVPIIFVIAIAGFLNLQLKKHSDWQSILLDKYHRVSISKKAIWTGFLLALQSWCTAFFYFFFGLPQSLEVYFRLLPLLTYSFILGLECIIFIAFIWLDGEEQGRSRQFSFLFGKAFWIVLAALIGIWLVIEITSLGITPELVSINSLNVPLLEGQVWFMAGMVILILALAGAWARLPRQAGKKGWRHPDLLICVALWALAAALWMSLPLPRHNYFAPATLPPNYAIYPFSDAEQYDTNSLWVWKGAIQGIVISKPLYVTFLAMLHALAGLDYAKLILLQTLVLALLPVVMYWIGKEMHSRLGGLVLALFVILREMNSIQAVNFANVSNSKLLLSDTPATLLIAVLLLLVIRWFKAPPGKDGKYPFLIGGLVACLNLIRIQTLLLEPVLLMLLVIRYWKQYKTLFQTLGLVLLALALVLAPVLVRNHAITGVYWLDNPATSSALYSFFLDENTDDLVDIPEVENEEDILNRNITVISQVLTQNFGNLVWSITDNFMHNVISTILIFPVRSGNNVDFLSFLHIDEPFWSEVYSRSNLWNALTLLLNLIIISIGIASAARKHLPSVLLVCFFYVIYGLSSAMVRISGWRFIQPVDWLAIAFYAFGLIEILRCGVSVLFGESSDNLSQFLVRYDPQPKSGVLNWRTLVGFGLLFLLIGAAIPLREVLFPVDYPDYTRSEVCSIIETALMDSPWADQRDELVAYCQREDVLAYEGIGVYPRFFKAGSGFYDRSYDPYFGVQDYGRLVFRTIGEPNTKAYIKMDNDDIRFPDGARVYVIGEDQQKFEARVVLIMADESQLIVSWPEEAEAE